MDEQEPITVFDWQRIFDPAHTPLAYLWEIGFRTMVMFLVLIIALKFLSKRGVKQLSVFELAILIALGSATGDLLAKSVGARLGVDAGVSDNAALGGAALTIGKYLSPKLYLSYGVGIFTPGEVITLRYKLSRMWELEAQNATTENRAGLNYRLEK